MQLHVKDLKRRAASLLGERPKHLREGTAGALRRMRIRRTGKA